MDIAQLQEKSRGSEKPGPVLTAEDGTMYRLNADNTAAPITIEGERNAPGPYAPGKAPKEKFKKPLKGTPKQRFNEVDADTMIREVGKEAKLIRDNGKKMRELQRDLEAGRIDDIDAEIERRAQEAVVARSPSVTGRAPAKPPNFFD